MRWNLAINILGGAVLGAITLAATDTPVFLLFQVTGAVCLWFINLLFASVSEMCAETIRSNQ